MNAYRAQQLQAAALIEQGADAEQIAAVLGWTTPPQKQPDPPPDTKTGDKRTLTAPRKCGIIKLIKRHVRRMKRNQEGKKMKIDSIIEKINNSCKPFDIDDLREIFTAAKYSEGLEMLKTCEDTEEIPLEIIDNALFNIGYVADDAGTYRKK